MRLCMIMLLLFGFVWGQSHRLDSLIIKYSIIKNETRNPFIKTHDLETKVKYLENIMKKIPDDFTVSRFENILDFQIIAVNLQMRNPLFRETVFWAYNTEKMVEIRKEKIEEFINEYIYARIDTSQYSDIIDLYNRIKFWNEFVHFFESYDEAIFVLESEYELYNRFFIDNDKTVLRKKYKITTHDGVEIHDIFYEFHWNGFKVIDILDN